MRLLALVLCIAFVTPARAQSCYGGGQAFAPRAFAAPQAQVFQQDVSPVEETTVVTTTTRTYAQSSQALALAPSPQYAPQCSSSRSIESPVLLARAIEPSCGASRQLAPAIFEPYAPQSFTPRGFAPQSFAPSAHSATAFATGPGLGGTININKFKNKPRRNFGLGSNPGADFLNTAAANGATININKFKNKPRRNR